MFFTAKKEAVFFFRKKWEIYQVEVNLDNGQEVATLLDIMEIAPDTYDMASLVIPPL